MSIEERFLQYVNKTPGCWYWEAFIAPNGYGRFRLGNRNPFAHRVSYELFVDEIPKGLIIDHLCRNRNCVNPDHLEPVTYRENIMRGIGLAAQNAKKTHCKRGHEFGEQSTSLVRMGRRRCKECSNMKQNLRRRLKNA